LSDVGLQPNQHASNPRDAWGQGLFKIRGRILESHHRNRKGMGLILRTPTVMLYI
jgi:hypothetical protein